MVTWEAPGPGYWELDLSHFVGGETPLVQHIQSRSMPEGLRRVFAELGTPADTLDCRFVNGFMYTRLRPLIAADRPAKNLPPRLRVESGRPLPSRVSAAHQGRRGTKVERPWRKVIDDWEHGGRALIESRNLAIQKVDLSELDDSDVRRTRAGGDRALPGQLGAPPLAARLRPRADRPLPRRMPRMGCRADRCDPTAGGCLAVDRGSDARARPIAGQAVEDARRVPRSLDDVRSISHDAAALLDQLPGVPRVDDDQPIRHRRCHPGRDPRCGVVDHSQRSRASRRRRTCSTGSRSCGRESPWRIRRNSTAGWRKPERPWTSATTTGRPPPNGRWVCCGWQCSSSGDEWSRSGAPASPPTGWSWSCTRFRWQPSPARDPAPTSSSAGDSTGTTSRRWMRR